MMTSQKPQAFPGDLREAVLRFANWTKQKVRLHAAKRSRFFHEREVWWCALGMNVGYEQDGKGDDFSRPVLILKKFNNDICWALPLTTKPKKGKYYYPIEIDGVLQHVILSQLRLIDRGRLQEKMSMIHEKEFGEVKRIVAALIAEP